MDTINQLQISYPDFQLNTVIDPEQFDTNNLEFLTKINEIITKYNAVNSTKIPTLPITGITGTDVQAVLQSLKDYVDVHKANVTNPHAVTATQLGVYTKSEMNNGQLDNRYYTETELNNGTLDTRYYTKADLDPYLRSGDTIIKYEVFTIVNPNNGNGTFTYSNSVGTNVTGNLTIEGYQIFALTTGNYALNQNRIECSINDTLQRSVASGGLKEIDTTHVALTMTEGTGAEITFKYYEKIGVTGTGLTVLSPTNPGTGFFWYKVVG